MKDGHRTTDGIRGHDDTKQVPGTSTSPSSPDLKAIASRITVGTWIATERRDYADLKYERGGEMWHKLLLDIHNWGLHEDGQWWLFLSNYLSRAQLLGLDTPAGQQAFGKFIVTALSCFEACVQVYGKPPKPGVTTGEIVEWEQANE